MDDVTSNDVRKFPLIFYNNQEVVGIAFPINIFKHPLLCGATIEPLKGPQERIVAYIVVLIQKSKLIQFMNITVT